MNTKCPHTECVNASDCSIIEITGKIPKTFDSCSYSKTLSQAEKLKKKQSKIVDMKPTFKKKKEWKAPAKANVPKGKKELTND